MKKRITSFLLLLCILVLTGCSSVAIPLTEEESDAIAQYSAYLMMKYDKNKVQTEYLLSHRDYDEICAELETTPTPIPTNSEITPTEAIAPVEQTKIDESMIQPTEPVVTEAPKVEDETIPVTLNDIFGLDGFDIQYKSFEVADNYQEIVFSPPGKDVLCIKFTVKNTSNKVNRFRASKLNVRYQLIKGNMSIEPKISLLENDIQFLNKEFKKDETLEAAIIFFVDSKTTVDYSFKVLSDSDDNNVKVYKTTIN